MHNALSFLLCQDEYDSHFLDEVYRAPVVSADQLLAGSKTNHTVRVEYQNNREFVMLAQRVGIMADLKALLLSVACPTNVLL